MYNIITAIGNEYINNELKKTERYNIVFGDIIYQEAVFQVLQNNKIDKLILLDTLQGELDKHSFIDEIINLKKDLDVIVINSNNDKKYSNYLMSKGIYKIINADELTINTICDFIDKDNSKQDLYQEYFDSNQLFNIKNNHTVIKDFDKKIIGINGTSGSGKTTFAVNLANTIASTYNKKVLIIDMDTINASVDKFLDIPLINKNIVCKIDEDKKCVLNYFSECIQKDSFSFEIFNQATIQYQKNKKVFVLTGNSSMFVCQNVLNEEIYNKILDKAKELYDYIVIDTSSNMFLDSTKWSLNNSEIIYYIFEGTYKDINNMKNSLIIFEKIWQIYSNKIKYVINKYSKNSLSKNIIQEIVENISIEATIPYDEKNVYSLNNGIPITIEDSNQRQIYESILGINRTPNFIDKIKNSIKGVF